MNNRDLLKEAIADAKAVKETAIANAKMALEEAFTPYLREKLSAKLAEMDEEDELKEADDKDGYEGQDSKEDLGTREMEEGREYDHYRGAEEDDAEHIKDLELDMKDDSEHTMDEMDLDELLRELGEMEEGEKEEMMEGEDLINNPTTTPTAHGNIAEEEEEVEVEVEDDEEIDLENMTEDDLKSFIEDVIADMVKAGELEGEMETEEEDEESEDDVEFEVEDEEEVTIDERKKQGYNDRLDDAEGAKHGKKKQDMKQRRADSENMEKADGKRKFAGDSQMKEEEMNEMLNQIETLKKDLNEVNLLNAKLLYSNKIFRAKNLTESQKVKVLESFDKATTAKEAKLVFETLSGEVKTVKKSPITESMMGGASKPAGVAARKPILEVNDQFARWQILAGIKK